MSSKTQYKVPIRAKMVLNGIALVETDMEEQKSKRLMMAFSSQQASVMSHLMSFVTYINVKAEADYQHMSPRGVRTQCK